MPQHVDEEHALTQPQDSTFKNVNELEEQAHHHAVEHNVPLRTKLLYLGAWFSLNLVLTMSNKAVLAQVCTNIFMASNITNIFSRRASLGFLQLYTLRLRRWDVLH